MFKKTITYEDFDGNTRTEDYMFNLTKSELLMWITTDKEYTLDKVLQQIVEKRNGRKIMESIEDLIRRSYGVKSLDGRRFEKSEEIWLEFFQSPAYSELFMQLISDDNEAAKFINGLVPKDMADALANEIEKHRGSVGDLIAMKANQTQ